MKPLVTFITPTYNDAPYIGRGIESVLAQTVPDWEQIVVDDGSTDGTGEVVAGYKDKRIRYFRLPHRGIENLGESYNHALREARGEFIAIMEGDDMVPPWKLQVQLDSFRPDTVLSYGKVGAVDSAGRLIGEVGRFPKRQEARTNTPPGAILGDLLRGNFIPAVSIVVRREALESTGGFYQPSYANWVDYPTCLRLASLGTYACVGRVAGYFRRHPDQDTHTNLPKNLHAGARYAVEFLQEVLADGSVDPQHLPPLNELRRWVNARAEARVLLDDGRKYLLEGQFSQARGQFWRLVRESPWLPAKAAALSGIGHSYLRRDMEWLFRLAKMQAYPPAEGAEADARGADK